MLNLVTNFLKENREKERSLSLWKRFVRVYFEAKFLGLWPISSTSSSCGLLRYVAFLNRDLENLPCYSILVHRTQLLAEFFLCRDESWKASQSLCDLSSLLLYSVAAVLHISCNCGFFLQTICNLLCFFFQTSHKTDRLYFSFIVLFLIRVGYCGIKWYPILHLVTS